MFLKSHCGGGMFLRDGLWLLQREELPYTIGLREGVGDRSGLFDGEL